MKKVFKIVLKMYDVCSTGSMQGSVLKIDVCAVKKKICELTILPQNINKVKRS